MSTDFIPYSFAGSLTEYIPYPASTGGTGDVVGPASSTDSALALFDGATGKLLKEDSSVYVSGTSQLVAPGVELEGTTFSVELAPDAAATEDTAYTFPPAHGTAGQVLTEDGAGALTWATPAKTTGTVTQITDVNTSVTLNTEAGAITTVAYNLATLETETFDVLNSTVTASSIVVVTMNTSSITQGFSSVAITGVSAGQFTISVTHLAAVALLGSLIINFVVYN